MSPDPTATRVGRVIRGRVASGASTLAFPTIEAVEPIAPAVVRSAASPADGRPATRPTLDAAALERARLEAAARGYADGLAAGRDEARAEVHAQARGLLEQLAGAVRRQTEARARTFDELSDDVSRFALATVEALVGRELELAANPTLDAVRRALRLAPHRAPAVVLVHPDDIDLLGPVGDVAGARAVEIVADPSIDRGGCIVRAGDCDIDAQIEAALTRLRDVLR